MAIDQREALIAAVRAQVEKEKAAKAAKLKKEQEAMQLSGAADAGEAAADHNKPKYKTLSAEELAKIEEKKRRKKAAELGIKLEDEEPEEVPGCTRHWASCFWLRVCRKDCVRQSVRIWIMEPRKHFRRYSAS